MIFKSTSLLLLICLFAFIQAHNHDHHAHSHHSHDHGNHDHAHTHGHEEVYTIPTRVRSVEEIISNQMNKLKDAHVKSLSQKTDIPNLKANTRDPSGGPF